MIRLLILALGASFLGGCAMIVAGAVGSATAPIVGPLVDRGLHAVGADWVDPAGTSAIK